MYDLLYKDVKRVSKRIPQLEKDEQIKTYREYKKTKDPNLKERLILSNLKVVIHQVASFVKQNNIHSRYFEDLIASSYLDCLERFDLYDPDKGNSSITSWIRANAYLSLLNNCKDKNLIRLPNSAFKRKAEQEKKINEFYNKKERYPNYGEKMGDVTFELFPEIKSGHKTDENGVELFEILSNNVADVDVNLSPNFSDDLSDILFNNKLNFSPFYFFILNFLFVKNNTLTQTVEFLRKKSISFSKEGVLYNKRNFFNVNGTELKFNISVRLKDKATIEEFNEDMTEINLTSNIVLLNVTNTNLFEKKSISIYNERYLIFIKEDYLSVFLIKKVYDKILNKIKKYLINE